jgi:hypothetical protein
MQRSLTVAALLIGAFVAPAAAAVEPPVAPTLDCALGFDGLRSMAQTLPGAQAGQWQGFDVVGVALPDTWKVEMAFTAPGHAAHPAVILRTLRKQVTGVWTADSKGCGYGDRTAFVALMADMKAGDTKLTNESRAEVEREKQGQSPLAPAP